MHESEMTSRAAGGALPAHLEMRWLPVTDEHGFARVQAVWIDATPATSAPAHHAA